MKHIGKQEPPQDLERYVGRENPQRWEDIHTSRYYPHLYCRCVAQLREEQSDISGYTEKPLTGQGVHVDHFKKQSLFPTRDYVFGWQNLIADEHHREYGADYKDNVINTIDAYQKLINPVEQDPHHFFSYMENGSIVPAGALDDNEKEIAEYTISTFNLQHAALRSKRCAIIQLVRNYIQGGLSGEEILACVGDYGFPSAIEYALK